MAEVVLKNKEAFAEVLKNYKVSEHAKKILSQIECVVLIGPAAAGRNTIINYLVRYKNYRFIVSDTTRPPKLRDGKMEQDGVNYYFRTEEAVLDDLKKGEFFEAEIIHDQQVSGTSIRELQKILESGQIAINDFEFGGARNVLAVKPDTKIFAVLPPSFEEWRHRFEKREKISETEFRNRSRTALKVVELIRSEPRVGVVINDDYETAANTLDRYVKGDPQTNEERQRVDAVLKDFEKHIHKLASSF